jgi:hypothetical protein
MKKRVIWFSAWVVFSLLFACCSGKNPNPQASGKMSDSVKSSRSANTNMETKPSKSNFELLQGKWQSTDDKTNILVFEKNHRKEISEGMDKWDVEEFILSDRCMNESNKNMEVEKEKDRYISVLKSDLSWYIIKLSSDTLSLSYMGRGNTLTYKKVK